MKLLLDGQFMLVRLHLTVIQTENQYSSTSHHTLNGVLVQLPVDISTLQKFNQLPTGATY